MPARAETVYARQVLLQGDVQKPYIRLPGPTHWLICAQVPKARCAKGINGLTDCTDLCRKFPNAPHTTTCCKCYPAC